MLIDFNMPIKAECDILIVIISYIERLACFAVIKVSKLHNDNDNNNFIFKNATNELLNKTSWAHKSGNDNNKHTIVKYETKEFTS